MVEHFDDVMFALHRIIPLIFIYFVNRTHSDVMYINLYAFVCNQFLICPSDIAFATAAFDSHCHIGVEYSSLSDLKDQMTMVVLFVSFPWHYT